MSGDQNANGFGAKAPGLSAQGQGGRHLPPPAFPPGTKRVAPHQASRNSDDFGSALILPDEPIPSRDGELPDDAFISPDEPIRHRPPHAAASPRENFGDEEGVVTGIGDDAHMAPDELAVGFDPHVLELVDKVGKLAEALKRRGEAGLRTTPEMSRFEATLRSYCVGYLTGRRAEDEEG